MPSQRLSRPPESFHGTRTPLCHRSPGTSRRRGGHPGPRLMDMRLATTRTTSQNPSSNDQLQRPANDPSPFHDHPQHLHQALVPVVLRPCPRSRMPPPSRSHVRIPWSGPDRQLGSPPPRQRLCPSVGTESHVDTSGGFTSPLSCITGRDALSLKALIPIIYSAVGVRMEMLDGAPTLP